MKEKSPLTGVAWIFGAATILYTILAWTVPLCIDDYMYINRWNDATDFSAFSPDAFIKFIKTSRNRDNFRISNMMAPFAVYFRFTRIVYPFVTGVCMGGIIYLGTRLSARDSNRAESPLCALIWLMMILFLPWPWLFVADYAINYIWGAAINLGALYLLFRQLRGKESRILQKTSLLLLAFIAGGWHEGFALPAVAGLALYALAMRGKLPVYFYFYLGVYLVGTLFFLWSPGLWFRIGETVGRISFIKKPYYLVVVALLVGLLILCAVTRRGKAILKKAYGNPVFITGLGIVVAGICMAMLTDNSPRCYLWPDLMAIICIAVIVNCSEILKKNQLAVRVASLLSLGLCIAQTILCIKFQYDIKRENSKLMNILSSSESGILFYDLDNFKETPWYCAHIPVNNFWESPWHYLVMRIYLDKEFCSVVPRILEKIEIENMTPLRVDPNFYEVDGYIVSENYIVSEWSLYNLGINELKMPEEKILQNDVNEEFRANSVVNVYPFVTVPYLHNDNTMRPDTLLYYKNYEDLTWK